LDAYLWEADWPQGSEIPVTAITIADMPRIIGEHGYVPVAVDLDRNTLAPSPEDLEAACTPRIVAGLHAHLFGAHRHLDGAAERLARRGVVLLEHCAQEYTGDDFRGSPLTGASFFSVGTITTATTLAGAITCIRDHDLRERVRGRVAAWPVEPRLRRTVRVARAFILRGLGHPALRVLLRKLLYRRLVASTVEGDSR
jgi:dTDP-4-amino-4,6-dideoxygalactose transaminase